MGINTPSTRGINAIIVVGIEGWEEFTLPAIKSIRIHNPDDYLILVDAGSKVPYPRNEYAQLLRLDESTSYAYALNSVIQLASKSDWYLLLNNDVICQGPIPWHDLHPEFIYTRQIIEEDGNRWMGLWIAAVSRKVWSAVGRFDEKFLLCGFEDADYCIRAKQLGIDTVHYPFPVRHLWGKTRWGLPGYTEIREDNINYFASKHGFRLGANMQVLSD